MMARALELAAKGVGQVSPGPLVGCVIVSPTGEIVGEGFYIFEDVKHAETIALELAGERARWHGLRLTRTTRASRPHAALHRCTDRCRYQSESWRQSKISIRRFPEKVLRICARRALMSRPDCFVKKRRR